MLDIYGDIQIIEVWPEFFHARESN